MKCYQNKICGLNPSTDLKRYEIFKLQWMIDHGHTLKELIHELTEYMEDRNLEMSPEDVFGEWESGRGFGSEIWPCFQEYLDSPESAEE